MLFHQVIARALRDHDAETIFGVMGDANLYMMDAFERHSGGRFVSVSNEAGAVLAANGFARVTGRTGFATVTHGPALTNIVTALVESVKDRTPVVVVAGDTAVVDRENFQNISQRDIVMPTGAGFEQVRSVDTVCEDVAVAVRRAWAERRPIVLNVPIELQWLEAEYREVPGRLATPQAPRPDRAVIEEAVGLLGTASRPIVLAGQGAFSAEATHAIVALAERLGAPLGTTLRARDLFRGQPHNLGIIGTLAHDVALDTIDASDAIIAFGAGLNKWTTAEGSVLEGRRVVQVDVDPAALNRFQQVDVTIVGDAAAVAESIVELLDEAELKPSGFASPALAERLAARRDDGYADVSTDEHVDIRTAMLRLEDAFPADRALVFDGGRFVFNAFKLLHVTHPRDYVHTVNFGSIGLGMGNAIGAAAGTGRPTLLVTGDGGFMLGGLAEFSTAVRHGLDLVVAVFNDQAYGAEHIQFRNKDMDPTSSTFTWPDFAPVAEALGGTGYTVRNLADLDDVVGRLADRDRPVLIDIKIDPDKVSMAGH